MAGYVFETARLRARHIAHHDVDDLVAVYGNRNVMRWVGDGEPLGRAACEEWVDTTQRNYAVRGYGMFALELRETGRVAGFCGLVHPAGQEVAELKYALREELWGRGLATEAARALLAYGRDAFGITRVIATTAPENETSHRVLRKVGMMAGELCREHDGALTLVFEWSAG